MNLTDDQLIEIYHIIFTDIHSNGFMTSEVKDLLFHPDYWFLTKPKEGWYTNLIQYLNQIELNLTDININPQFIS